MNSFKETKKKKKMRKIVLYRRIQANKCRIKELKYLHLASPNEIMDLCNNHRLILRLPSGMLVEHFALETTLTSPAGNPGITNTMAVGRRMRHNLMQQKCWHPGLFLHRKEKPEDSRSNQFTENSGNK